MEMHKEARRQTLGYVNSLRVVFHHEPLTDLPRGIPRNCGRCPVANALTEAAQVEVIAYNDSILFPCESDRETVERAGYTLDVDDEIRVPRFVTEFIGDFDSGLHPDLIAER